MKHNSTIRDIDLAWERINAMGGVPCCAHDHVYNLAINDCLRIIESLGGYDPAARRHARQKQYIGEGMRAEDSASMSDRGHYIKLGTPPTIMEDDGGEAA